ncbi:hypothetical protein BCR35DRAFT_355360 [Leucosporidium creatinivorum]|uniref:Acetyl-CoA synthetase-like protein n=1 Tax=Leucosporidium creatinivorum TaxID=106004 RepID=A0A1Y2DHP6_9BASI|nr:hypothetical protein BCR35DRAFT_355360 [Leucosporidium creatinivorum]
MYYDPKTSIYTGAPPAVIPDGLSLYDFMFHWRSTPNSTKRPDPTNSTWLIDSLDGRTLSFEGAHERTLNIARAFHSLGVGSDDCVLLFSGNEVDYATSLWASSRLGAVTSTANPAYTSSELTYQLNIVNEHNPVKVLVVHPDSLLAGIEAVDKSSLPTTSIVLIRAPDETTDPKAADLASNYRTLDDLIAELQSLDLPPTPVMTAAESKTKAAFYIFSSGTTGLPKATCISAYSVIAHVLQAASHWSATLPFTPFDPSTQTGDKVMACLPFYHIYGLVVVLHQSLFFATPVVVLRKFSLPTFLGAIERFKISILYVVPPMVVLLVKNDTSKYNLDSVRAGMTGAAPLTEETSLALQKKFPTWTFGQGYGMTETCTIISLFAGKNTPGASAGRLVPSVEGKIVSPEGKLLPPGEIGELWSRSPSNALGYLGNEKATAETFDLDGFVHTGDECRFDDAGWLYVVDRIKELIKVKGFQVAPAELEGHLLEHPLVQDVGVIGIVDEKDGERPKAFIHLVASAAEKLAKDPSLAEELSTTIKQHVKDHKVHYKHLGEVEFVPAIPKTPSGKLLRKDLRALHAASEKSKPKL